MASSRFISRIHPLTFYGKKSVTLLGKQYHSKDVDVWFLEVWSRTIESINHPFGSWWYLECLQLINHLCAIQTKRALPCLKAGAIKELPMLEQTVQPWYLRAFPRSSDDEGVSAGPKEPFSSELNTILDKGTKQFQAFACDQEKMLDVETPLNVGMTWNDAFFCWGGTFVRCSQRKNPTHSVRYSYWGREFDEWLRVGNGGSEVLKAPNLGWSISQV